MMIHILINLIENFNPSGPYLTKQYNKKTYSCAQRLNSFLMGGSIERQKNVCFLIIFLKNW